MASLGGRRRGGGGYPSFIKGHANNRLILDAAKEVFSDAGATTPSTHTGLVRVWKDQSGYANNATAPAGANKTPPTWLSTYAPGNGRPAVQFVVSGADKQGLNFPLIGGAHPSTWFVVYDCADVVGDLSETRRTLNWQPNGLLGARTNATTGMKFQFFDGDEFATTANYAQNDVIVHTMRLTAGTGQHYVNGTSIGTTTNPDAPTAIGLGDNDGGGAAETVNGRVLMALAYNADVFASIGADVNNWLIARFGA